MLEGPSSILLVAHGDLDFEAAKRLRGTVDHVLAVHPHSLVLDLGDVDFLDSSGVAMMLRLRRSVLADSATVTICSLSPAAHRTLELCGLLESFGVEPTGVA